MDILHDAKDTYKDPIDVFGVEIDKPYRKETVDEIVRYRQEFGDQLFIDRLLTTLGVENVTRLYPPKSGSELRKLHEYIIRSASPDHHKLAVLYYIRKDFPSTGRQNSRQAAEKVAKTINLPGKYKILVDGLWLLDRFKFERALDYLTEPTLIPTYPEEILLSLCRHAPKNDCSLPLAYYHTVQPDITSEGVIEALFLALCQSSITEAFFFSRKQNEATHHKLFHKLIHFIHADSTDESKAMRGATLISLPLNETEDSWVTEYLKDGQGKKLPHAKDTLIMRGLTKGDFKLLEDSGEKLAAEKINGVNWAMLKESLRRELKS